MAASSKCLIAAHHISGMIVTIGSNQFSFIQSQWYSIWGTLAASVRAVSVSSPVSHSPLLRHINEIPTYGYKTVDFSLARI